MKKVKEILFLSELKMSDFPSFFQKNVTVDTVDKTDNIDVLFLYNIVMSK